MRTYAPVGQTPIRREWWTRDHLSAICAISPEGKVYFHIQDRPINSDDVVAFLEHLRREVPGHMVIVWDGAPIHHSHTIQAFLANGASHRPHLERLPAYAPDLGITRADGRQLLLWDTGEPPGASPCDILALAIAAIDSDTGAIRTLQYTAHRLVYPGDNDLVSART